MSGAQTTVARAQGQGDSRRLATRHGKPGAGRVAQYNRQASLRDKIRLARQKKQRQEPVDNSEG